MAVNVGSIVAYLELQDKMSAQLTTAGNNVAAFGQKAQAVGEKISGWGHSMVPLSASISATATSGLAMSGRFERDLGTIVNLVGVAKDKVDEWRDSILEIGVATGKGPDDLAKALFTITSGGIRGAEALQILENAARASAIGLGDTAEIGRVVTQILVAYGPSVISAERATELMVGTVRAGNLAATDLAGSIGRILPLASSMGVKFEDVGAFVAAYTRVGGDAAEATTALRGVLNMLLGTTKEGAELLSKAGTSAAELRDEIREKGLISAMSHLKDVMSTNEEAMKTIVPNVRALSGVLATVGVQGSQMGAIMKDVNDTVGVLGSGMKNVGEETAFRFDQMKAKAEVLAIKIGDALKPAFLALKDAMSPIKSGMITVIDAFQAAPPVVQKVGFAIIGMAALGAPALMGLGAAVKMVGFTISGLGDLMKGASAAVHALGNTVPVLTARLALMDASAKGATLAAGGLKVALMGLGAAAAGIAIGAVFVVQSRLIKDALAKAQADIDHFREQQANGGKTPLKAESWIEPQKRAQAQAIREMVDKQKEMDVALGNTGDALAGMKLKVNLAGIEQREMGKISLEVAKSLEVQGPMVVRLGKAMDDKKKGTRELTDAEKEWLEQIKEVNATLSGAATAKEIEKLEKAWQMLTPAQRTNLDVVERVVKQYDELAPNFSQLSSVLDPIRRKWTEMTVASVEGASGQRAAALAINEMIGAMTKLDPAATKTNGVLINNAATSKELDDKQKALRLTLGGLTGTMGMTYPSAVHAATDAVDKHAKATAKAKAESETWKDRLRVNLGSALATFGQVFQNINSQLGQSAQIASQAWEIISDTSKGGAERVGAALTGLSGIFDQFGQKTLSAMAGAAAAGVQLGSSFGAVGAAVGGVIGGLIGLFGGLGASAKKMREENAKATEEIGKLQAELVKQYGSMERIAAVSNIVGTGLFEAWGHKGVAGLAAFNEKVEEFKAAISEIEGAAKEATDGIVTLTATQVEQIRALMAAGLPSDTLDKFFETQQSNVIRGAVGLVDAWSSPWLTMMENAAGFADRTDEVKTRIEDLTAKIIDMNARGGPATEKQARDYGKWKEEVVVLQHELDKLVADHGIAGAAIEEFSKNGQEQFERYARFAEAAFGTAVLQGKGFLGALAEIGPSLDQLALMTEKFGFKADDTLKSLLSWNQFAKDNPQTVAALDSLNQMMTGLWNSGMLNDRMFQDLGATAVDIFKKMTEQGKGGEQGMRAMQPTLQSIWQIWKDTGWVLDENTEKLIRNAEEAGIVGEKFKDPARKQVDALEAIQKVLGDLTKFFREDFLAAITGSFDATQAIARDTGRVIDAEIGRRRTVPVTFDDPGTLEEPTRGFAGGTGGSYPDFGAGTLVMLHGRERVMTEGEREGGGGSDPRLLAALSELTNMLRALPDNNARAVRAAALIGRA